MGEWWLQIHENGVEIIYCTHDIKQGWTIKQMQRLLIIPSTIHQTIQSIVIVRSIGPHQQHAVLKGQPCLAALLVPATAKVRDGATFGLPIERLFHELDLT